VFANRYTAFADACSLVNVLKRNLLLTLAEAEFFRLRWSKEVLDETEKALAEVFANRNSSDPDGQAALQRARMERAFEDAMVSEYDAFMSVGASLPDANDAHVLAAALKTQAAVIITDNLKHFPASILAELNMEARSTDAFLANTIALDYGRAVAAVQGMRLRFNNPAITSQGLLVKIEAAGLTETADTLRDYELLL
jgi:predicted nucleic acid-binding protein